MMNSEFHAPEAQLAAMQAYQQLIRLNLSLHNSEIADWLHSEAAEPALRQMLENVPCFGRVH